MGWGPVSDLQPGGAEGTGCTCVWRPERDSLAAEPTACGPGSAPGGAGRAEPRGTRDERGGVQETWVPLWFHHPAVPGRVPQWILSPAMPASPGPGRWLKGGPSASRSWGHSRTALDFQQTSRGPQPAPAVDGGDTRTRHYCHLGRPVTLDPGRV